jgi:putative transposase
MPRRHLKFKSSCYYHLYNRGVNHSPIFRERENYLYLLRLLKKNLLKYDISMIAYSLMPNHYHLFLRPEADDTLAACLKSVFLSYVQAFNKRFGRSGPLFEGRFNSVLVDQQFYMLHLCRYIHLNPVDAGLVELPEHWEFSNYREWIGMRNGELVNKEFIKSHFAPIEKYIEFVRSYELSAEEQAKFNRYIFTPPRKLGASGEVGSRCNRCSK